MIQSGYCPAISLVGETSVSGSLQAMDCHINAAVQTGYNRLFGAGGAFGYALTALLIIYVGMLAVGFLTGRTSLTLTMMSPRVMTMVLVLTFVTFWPAYHALFYGLLMGGPDEIAAALLGERGSAVMNFAQSLDGLFVKFAEIARSLDAGNTGPNPGIGVIASHSMPVTLFWLSGLCLLVSTLGVLILTRLTLYLLLILGPIFIVFGLFPQTRGLFNGWIRTSLVFALAPMFTVLGGTAALMLFVPLIQAIGDDPLGAVNAIQPMVILFMGSMIYCAFLFTLMWVAANLVKDWQATWRDKPAAGPAGNGGGYGPITPIYPMPAQPAAPMVTLNGRGPSDSFARTEPLVTAVTREAVGSSGSGGSRSEVLGLYDPQARAGASASGGDRFSRVQGLGQRFRPTRPIVPPVTPSVKP